MFKARERNAWDVSNVDSVLEKGADPRLPIEAVLRSVNTLRRCVESSLTSDDSMTSLLRHPSIVPILYYWLENRAEPGASGARLKEHIVFIFINLLGHDPSYDEMLAMDGQFVDRVLCGLTLDENSIVASAASQLVRRISELSHLVGILCFTDRVMPSIIEALAIAVEAREHTCAGHYLSALINLTSNTRAHFSLARNQPLIQVFLAILRQSHTNGEFVHLGVLAGKSLANLLYFPENIAVLTEQHRDLIIVLADCAGVSEGTDETIALSNVCSIALDYCHDKGAPALEIQMRAEFQQSPASLPRVGVGLPPNNASRRNIPLE